MGKEEKKEEEEEEEEDRSRRRRRQGLTGNPGQQRRSPQVGPNRAPGAHKRLQHWPSTLCYAMLSLGASCVAPIVVEGGPGGIDPSAPAPPRVRFQRAPGGGGVRWGSRADAGVQ